MMKWILPGVFFLLFIGCVIGAIIDANHNTFSNIKNQKECEDPMKTKLPNACKDNKTCCAVWDGICRKGSIEGDACASSSNVGFLLLIILSVVFFIGFVVFVFLAFKKSNVNNDYVMSSSMM